MAETLPTERNRSKHTLPPVWAWDPCGLALRRRGPTPDLHRRLGFGAVGWLPMTAPEVTAWQALTGPECLLRLEVGDDGLNEAGAAERMDAVGPNRLALPEGPGRWRILLDQFSNVMLILLLAVAAVSAGLAVVDHAFPKDAIAILMIVALTALLGYLQESRAQLALRSLLSLAQPLARVRRDGLWQRLPSEQLVPAT